ncbi:MAG: hypothetical protein ACPGZP_10685 [Panacagrimonas sp.]
MSTYLQPISEVSHNATLALVRELGVVNTIRFLNQFRAGSGDYTHERDELFNGQSVQAIVSDIEEGRR